MTGWQFNIDRGGTFTDIVAISPNGEQLTHKLLSDNPQRYPDASLQGIRDLLQLDQKSAIPSEIIASVRMGTTVATNALLQHQGERLVLAITTGFGDALRIAYQNRPELFSLDIQLPKPLYCEAIEINERLDANGNVLTPLDYDKTRTQLSKIRESGISTIAIVLLHADRFSNHELQVGKLAAEMGFKNIYLSHQISPLIKLVSRGETTTLDAYLTPLLKRYIDHINNELEQSNLFFMQSNGGLTRNEQFSGKNSILSGPAAGVIGAVESAQAAGIKQIISFDMGGTSTDVAHYDDELEYTDESMIAGFHLRAPMLEINTIAAGGGSILSFQHDRYQVGPESAGANPGPCAYGRDGPLTITDCNVLLGRIQTAHFPAIVGKHGNKSLDIAKVQERFTQLCEEIADGKTAEDVATGFLTVATNNMANAIKKISIARGHDISKYTLCAFGAAAGQHACAIADELDIEAVFIHPQSSVLSAYGMHHAPIKSIVQQSIEKELTPKLIPLLDKSFKELDTQGQKNIAEQNIADLVTNSKNIVHVRYSGTDNSIPMAYVADNTKLYEMFNTKHQALFGYSMQNHPLTVEATQLEITAKRSCNETQLQNNTKQLTPEKISIYIAGKTQEANLYQRQQLQEGTHIKGPALIVDQQTTIVVDIDWGLSVIANGGLILKRTTKRTNKPAVGTNVDHVLLEVFNNRFMAIAEQMGTALQKTAYSVNIKERLDFSCAIFDASGDLVANAPHIPVHLGSMSVSVKNIIEQRTGTMQPGDVYMLNDPYHGGTHLPDVTVITPVYDDNSNKQPLCYVASRAHEADIGGTTPGSIPAHSSHISEEGILIDNFKLIDRGEFLDTELRELLLSSAYPVRNIEQNIADLQAQIAANQKGVTELKLLMNQYSLQTIQAYMQHIQNNAQSTIEQVIKELKDGEFVVTMDNECKIAVKITIDRTINHATIDFTGTSTQQTNNFNAPKAVVYAAVLYVFRCLAKKNIPLNQGCLKPVTIIIPEKSMLNPKYPAPVVAGNVETSQCIVDALFGALDICAASQGTMNNITFGNEQYQYYETICGGAGAGNGFNGASAVQTHMTNSRMTDPEVLELRFPVIVRQFSIRNESGGNGKWHGGNGAIRHLEFNEPMKVSMITNRRHTKPFGLSGGGPGLPGVNIHINKDNKKTVLNHTAEFEVNSGDSIVIKTPGGGSYGKK